MSSNNEEKELTAEDRDAEIARLQAEKSAAATALAEQEKIAKQHREEFKQRNAAQSFLAEIGRSGISWHIDPDDLRKLVDRVCVIRTSEDGKQLQALDKETGEDIGIRKALERTAIKHQHVVKDNTASHLLPQRADDGTYRPLSRQDLTTWGQKSAFIDEHGLQAYSELGAKSQRGITSDIDRMTAEDVGRMSRAQRSDLVKKYGSEIYSQILSRRRKP
jgi:hypothetical protein